MLAADGNNLETIAEDSTAAQSNQARWRLLHLQGRPMQRMLGDALLLPDAKRRPALRFPRGSAHA